MKKLYSNFLLILLALLSLSAHSQQPGSLDTDFSLDGKVTTGIGNNYDAAECMAIQPDGKILVGGYSNNGSDNDFVVARFNVNGELDEAFGNDGVSVVGVGSKNEKAFGIALQPDGKIVLVGTSNDGSNNDFAVLRFTEQGMLDRSFHGGIVITNAGYTTEQARAVAVQADGKIIVGGSSNGLWNNSDFTLIRYNTDGSLDNSFGKNGFVKTDLNNSFDFLYAIALQGNGKIIAVGSSSGFNPEDFAAVRYNSNGTLDKSFANEGKFISSFGPGVDEAYSVALQLDNKIVIAGTAESGVNFDFAVMRLDVNGGLDPSFGNGGKALTALGANDKAFGVVIQSDQKIVAAGLSVTGNGSDFSMVRYNINGTLDNSFSDDGKVITKFGAGTDIASAVALQSDGRIVVCGTSAQDNDDFALARYTSEISLGISEKKQNKIGVYYNHNNYDLIVNGTEENGEVMLFDIIGNRITTGETSNKKTILNTGPIAPGVYLLNYQNGRNASGVKFVIR
jgi:uncharacterized delta-60 repeat protein